MNDTISKILSLSGASNWEFRNTADINSELVICGLTDDELEIVQDVVNSIIMSCFSMKVLKGDNFMQLNPQLSECDAADAMRYMWAGKDAYPMYDEESSEPVVKYTEEEFKKKCEDPVFKLASDIERYMYGHLGKLTHEWAEPEGQAIVAKINNSVKESKLKDLKLDPFRDIHPNQIDLGPTRFDNGYVELASMSAWLEAQKVQIETNRAIMMHQFSLTTATGEDLDNIAANMNMPKFEAIGGMGTIEILKIIEPFTTGSGIWTAPKEDKIEVTMIGGNGSGGRNSSTEVSAGSCDHELKHYVSFNGQEEFDYCEKCEVKL